MDTNNGNNSVYWTKKLRESSHFRCVVSNGAGVTTSNVTVYVLSKDTQKYIALIIAFVIAITTHPQNKEVAIDSTVSFACISSISFDVTFSWIHNGISITGYSTTGDTSILTITNVRDSDVGIYVCTVSSGLLSVTSNTATLTVYGMMTI